jgi:peptide/nickel transport system ATP-binding protein/oligopeptide transport system ATP-binding protein
MKTAGPVLEIEDLKTFFYTREGVSRAVNGVGISLSRGEILGVVGESGCGKSLTALSILRLVPHPGRIVSGAIRLRGSNLIDLSEKQMRKIRGDRISMIFQEPMISLNPAFTIENQLVEAVQTHRQVTRADAVERAIEMLKLVEIPAPERRIKDYPHQLSGGMRQRVMIAEALLLDPEVLLADEPTTALDVTIQAQILDIMYRLNQDTGTAIVLITHNLGLVAESANRVVVMYAGKVVEEGPAVAIFDRAGHPYTQGLLRSLPKPRRSLLGKKAPLHEMSGIVPSLFNLPTGCAFHPRCPSAKEICRQQEPSRFETEPGHFARCWLFARDD